MALSKYDKEFMTEREQETVARLTKLYDEGKLDGASAHNAVENIRSKYGYSGGTDGSGYVATTGDADPAQAIYDRLVASGKQSGGNKSTLERLAQMSYSDWKQGEEYRALQEMYRRNADTAMQDVLGQLSARTGGLASSYAAAAASQQYADVMAQLEGIARQMYEGDRSAAMDVYQLQQQAADKAYDRAMVERQYTDAQTLQRKQEAETGKADARDRVNAYLAAGGSAANLDRALLQQSGYSDAEIAAFEKYYAQQLAAANAKGKSSGGGDDAKGSKLYDDILKKALKYEDYDEAIAYLNRMVAAGHISEDEKNIMDTVYLGGIDDGVETGEEISSYDQLSKAAKSKLTSMQLQIRRDGGLTEAQKNSLVRAAESGEITEDELDYMMQVLGI